MKTRKIRHANVNMKVFCILFGLLSYAAYAGAQDYLTVKETAPARHVGDNISIGFEVKNPTTETKKFTCVLAFDPPTSKRPACKTLDITLEPGETYLGYLSEFAQLPADSKVTLKLVDENNDVVEERAFDIKIVEPGRIACGDAFCDLGENHKDCPHDCTSGGRDGLCDALAEGVCDPDCSRIGDPDCICNLDGACDNILSENFRTCPKDCPSGSADDFCDKAADAKCDPDCSPSEDPECGKEAPANPPTGYQPYVTYILAAGVFVIIAAGGLFLYRRREDKKIDREREEFIRWKEKN